MVSDYISIYTTITLIRAIELTCVYVNDHLQNEYYTELYVLIVSAMTKNIESLMPKLAPFSLADVRLVC